MRTLCGPNSGWYYHQAMSRCAREHGYDSIQYTHYFEYQLVRYEIVDYRDMHTQGEALGGCWQAEWSQLFSRGWGGGREECRCVSHDLEPSCERS